MWLLKGATVRMKPAFLRIVSRYSLVLLLAFVPVAIYAQSSKPLPDAPRPQPSAGTQPSDAPGPLPVPPGGLKPTARPDQQPAQTDQQPADTNQQPAQTGTTESGSQGGSQSGEQEGNDSGTSPAMPPIRTMPRGTSRNTNAADSGRDDFTIRSSTNYVVVPVTVKDNDGHLVAGLERRDFALYEDDVEQNLRLFTSDPFPLAAAVVIDRGMSDTAMRRLNSTLPSIAGAFSQYDEVAVYTYGNTVKQVSDFAAATSDLAASLKRARSSGRTGGVPVTSGPMAAGPTVNGHPLDPSTPQVNTSVRGESHSLNDAILRAATDLATRDRTRRKIIFIVSDGEESGSSATFGDVMKVLLSNGIQVFALGVDSAAIPGYGASSRVHIPGFGYGNILPKYVSATGGDYFTEFTRDNIEQAYARITEEARNQYTLAYQARTTASSAYRSIEVRVKRPGLKVYAKDGYYPLPPRRLQPPASTSKAPPQ